MQQLLFTSKRQRATSVQEPPQGQLPNIVTPTFGDWKIINDLKAHPKISRRNPLFNKFCLNRKKATTPQANQHINQEIFRDLRSEEQSQRVSIKENFQDRVSTTETQKKFESDRKNLLYINNFDIQQIRAHSVGGNEQSMEKKSELFVECQQLFQNQKKIFDNILKQNSLYTKYGKVVEKQQHNANQKLIKIFNQYK